MTAEERNKEIEWLMESIQRSGSMANSVTLLLFIISGISIAFGLLTLFLNSNDNSEILLLMFGFGGLFLIAALISHFFHKAIANAETPEKLLAAYDRMWIVQSALGIILVAGSAPLIEGNIFTKTCFALGMVLILLTGWLVLQRKLRLWVAVILLIVESVLLYFSKIGLLAGIPLLFVMLSIIKGEMSLSRNEEGEGLDENDEKNIMRLRELLKERDALT